MASLAAVSLEELQGLARRPGLYHVASSGGKVLKTRQDKAPAPGRAHRQGVSALSWYQSCAGAFRATLTLHSSIGQLLSQRGSA